MTSRSASGTSVDHRTRLRKDMRDLDRDEVFDDVLSTAIDVHGDLAARGVAYKQLPSLGFLTDGRGVTLRERSGALVLDAGVGDAGVVAELPADALSDVVQDIQSTMGLAMTSRVKITGGTLDDWIGWEPALRALLDGRPVYENGTITFDDGDGGELDLSRSFTLDDVTDDRDEVAHFLAEAGFLHVRDVFTEAEMAAVSADLDEWLARAEPDDGASWWAEDADGRNLPVRVLWFHEKSETIRELLHDERFQWLARLTGDDHNGTELGCEGLIKPLGIVNGLSDLPWHKDCGQGQHSYSCNGLTAGISVTGADRVSGALGVIPGSHRANVTSATRDRSVDLEPRMLETSTGDLTVHCSDTMHRAHPPKERPRKVVYSGIRLRPLPGDEVTPDPRYSREARADLTSVRDRIEAADNEANDRRFKANPTR